MQWYYAENQKPVGPIEEEVFLSLVRAGRIASGTLVWHEGLAQWIPYGETPPPPPPASPPFAPPLQVSMGACVRCRRTFRRDQMIQFHGSTVCAECKPVFFQAVQEGADSPETGGSGSTPNRELMALARDRLRNRWGPAIGITILFTLISWAIQLVPYVSGIVQIFLLPPFALGITTFFIALARNQYASTNMLGEGFTHYWPSVGTSFFVGLIWAAGFLATATPAIALGIYAATKESMDMIPWVVALAIPALFVSTYITLMFALPFYIIADDRSVGIFEVLTRSRLIMQGMKWKLFCLHCRFIGWSLLALLTLGIGFIWVVPYFSTSEALFYDDVRGRLQDHPQ